jgi:hypothetical protein
MPSEAFGACCAQLFIGFAAYERNWAKSKKTRAIRCPESSLVASGSNAANTTEK